MFMNKEYQNYKIKVEKLQQQVWKSEMQRKELEYKFEQLMRDRNQCEKSAIKSIKTKYKKFMEEDEERTNRNSTLMKMLERIDYQAATLAAKTERLKLLKAQHELYLMKTWNIPCPITQQLPHPSRLQTYSHQSYEKLQSMAPSTIFNTLRAEQPQFQQQQQSQSIYPSSFTPHECETNLKSDFVKYLSNINQFPGTVVQHEKNNFVDNTLSMLSQQQQPKPSLPQTSSSSLYSQHIYRYPMTNENLLQTTSSYDNGGGGGGGGNITTTNLPNENWNSYSRTANKYDGSIINLSDKPLAIQPTNTTAAYGNLYNENCIIEDDNQLYGGHSKKNQQNMPFVSSTMQQYLQQQRQPPNIQIVPPAPSMAGGGCWENSSPTYLSHTNQDIYGNVQNQQQQQHLLNSTPTTTTASTIQPEAANLNIKASATDIQKNSQHYPTPTTTTFDNDDFDSRNIGVGVVVGDSTNNSNNIEYGVHRTQNINENNSSAAGIQMTKDINSRNIADAAAVSISNTSVNAGTINTNAEKLTINDGSNVAIVRHDLADRVIAPFVPNTIPNIQRDANTSNPIVNQQKENVTNQNENDNYGDKIDYSLQKENSNKNDNEDIIEKHENDDEKTEKSSKNIIKLNENANGTTTQENISNDIIDQTQQEQSMYNQKKIYYEPTQQTNTITHDNNLLSNEGTKSTTQQYQQQQLPPTTTIHHQEPHQIETNETNLNGNLYETDIQQHSYNNQSDAIISNHSVDDAGTYGVDGNYPEGINYDNVNEQQQPLYTTAEDNTQYEITNQDGQQQYDDTNQPLEQQQYVDYNYENDGQYFGNEMNNATVDYTSTVQQDSSNIVDGTYVEQDYNNSAVAVDGNQLLNADGQTIASYQDPTQTDVYQQNDQLENVVNYPEDMYGQQNVYPDDQTYADYQYQVEPGQDGQYNPEMYAGYENAPQDNQQLDPNQYSTIDNNNYYSQEPGENYYADESQQQYLNEDGTTITASGDLQQQLQHQEYIENDQNISNLNVQQETVLDYNNMPIDNGNLNAPETDTSSTTYSENVNVVPQPILNSVNINDQQQQIIDAKHPAAAANKILLNQQKATKNFLDSETDDSSTITPAPAAATTLSADVQQVKQISNDESDFDFSAN